MIRRSSKDFQEGGPRERSPSLKFNRRPTIKMTEVPKECSRKEKLDFFETKFKDIDDLIPQIEVHITDLETRIVFLNDEL